MKQPQQRLEEFVNELRRTINYAPSAELALLVKYISLIAVLASMPESARIKYVSDGKRMQGLVDAAIIDLLKLPRIARRYERSKRSKAN